MHRSRAVPRCISSAQPASKVSYRSVAQRGLKQKPNSVPGSRVAITSKSSRSGRNAALILSVAVGGGVLLYPRNLYAESAPPPAEIEFEAPRKKAASKEDSKDFISSQHLQVKRSWENPGVYAWGKNTSRVVAPNSDEVNIKIPKRIAFFDGKVLRDIKFDSKFGVAVDENGDLLQWGAGFSPNCRVPTPTLKGKDIIKISISRDRIIALSSSGIVFSVPASYEDLDSGPKLQENSWIPFWKSRAQFSYRTLVPKDMAWGEKVTKVSSGLEHCLLLTSKGRLFSAASGTEDFPSKGQMGIPGLTWTTRPEGPYDQPHEITTLRGFEIAEIAAGDYHSLAVDRQGRVFAFGDSSLGQLGLETNSESPNIDAPSLVPIDKLYRGTGLAPRVTNVAAGGINSFFTVDATRIQGQDGEIPTDLGRVTADTWSCGQGTYGALGNGRWTHIQEIPTKIKSLSGLFEYDETAKVVIPIRMAYISVGTTHVAATMANVTEVSASKHGTENETNWGADVVWWGGNEFYQLGTGKRSNVNAPLYIAPLDAEAERAKGRKEDHRFQITPRKVIRVRGRDVSVEQRVECGRGVTAVYSGL
ncbi:mitochondrial protein-like protein Fmp25 [Calycina marina]|uniref:Mitochondrial protein-like protein Fmp25 n=1 Tax=Calycina marina TaxID=1763456 RepID=A0A9P7Z0T8_9HELO|nr:mitochondrial protein-like protein Fmp25 [Calycina marina]